MTIAIVLLLSIGAVVLWASGRFHRGNELGFVSAQWLAEYRQNNES